MTLYLLGHLNGEKKGKNLEDCCLGIVNILVKIMCIKFP